MQTLRFAYPLRRYIHERLGQCPEQERLEARARQLASDAGRSWPLVGPLEARLFPCRGSALQEAFQTLPATASAVRTACRQMLHLQLHPRPTA